MSDTTLEPMPAISHEWEPIEDLPANWHDFCRPDLHAVHGQWVAERNLIKDPAKIEVFQEKLALRWAIETGVIERLYTMEPWSDNADTRSGTASAGSVPRKGTSVR